MEDRMAAKLGDPETDPHGHPIPERNGAVRTRQEVPLLKWVCGVPAVVSSVSDRDPAALRDMERMGLLPGVALLVEPGTRGGALFVTVGDNTEPLRLNQKLARAIFLTAGPIRA
jgi:DtxR family Mn-dependent transcriptional regulator